MIDIQGNRVSSAFREWSYDIPSDADPMGREFDPGVFWEIICQLVGECIKKAEVSPVDIIAVSTASQRQGVVFLDKSGHELYAGPNVDLRAIAEGFEIDFECGNEIYRITGHSPSLLFTPAKLKWFQKNRPQIYEKIATVLPISDWIIYRLSGERAGEVSCSADIGLVDISQVKWSGRLMEMLKLPEGICPELVTAGTCVGNVTASAAEQSGLAQGTAVVVGGADTQCCLLGMGIREEGQVGIAAGWSGSIQMVTRKPIIDSNGRLWTGCHALPGKWVLESNAQETGAAYKWLKDMLFGESNSVEDTYKMMDELAQEVPPGAMGVVSFIGPMQMDMTRLRPSLGGFLFHVTPSITSIERRHLVRAAHENICFAFKANCVQLEEVSQVKLNDVRIGGGLTQSGSLVQTLADVLGSRVTSYEVPQVTSWGTAMCAAVGAGIYPDLEQAMIAMQPGCKIVEPDPQRAQEYEGYYQRWLSTAKWLDTLYEAIG